MKKMNLILLGLAVVQTIILLVRGGGEDQAKSIIESGDGKRPYETLTLEKIGRLEFTDEDGQSVILERKADAPADAKSFGLATADGFPIRAYELENAVKALGKAALGKVASKRESAFVELEVADQRFARHIVAKDAQGQVLADFFLGEGKGAGSSRSFLRKKGENVAYHVSGINTYEFSTSRSSWADTATWYDQNADDVTKISIEVGTETLALESEERPKAKPESTPEKPKDETKPPEPEKPEMEKVWFAVTPEGKKDLDASKVKNLLSSATKITISEPFGKAVKPEYSFEKPTAKAVVTYKDGATHTITVGATHGKDNEYYVSRTGSEFIASIRSYTYDAIFKKKLDDLLPTKPGETPKDEHEGHDHGK